MPLETKNKCVVFICTEKEDYPRNAQILQALKQCCKVIKITSQRSSYALRIPEVIFRFLWLSLFCDYHLVYAGFLGQPVAAVIKIIRKRPVILDAFVSVYDVLCLDRKYFKPSSLAGSLFFWLDKISFELADRVVTDTKANAIFFSRLFKIGLDKFCVLYASADEKIFKPFHSPRKRDKFKVFFHSTFWPLHGIEYIVKAAKLLEKEDNIQIQLLGGGREKDKIAALAENLSLQNLKFIDWVSYQDLSQRIAGSDICLGGHFSNADKAKRVISGKTFMYLAMKKTVIIADNPATRELFVHRRNAYMCLMADEQALADAIVVLKNNPSLRTAIAEEGFRLFKSASGNQETQKKLVAIMNINYV